MVNLRQRVKDKFDGTKRCNTGCGAASSGQPVKMANGSWGYLCLDHKKDLSIKERVNIPAQEERIRDREQDAYEDRVARARVKERLESERGQGRLF